MTKGPLEAMMRLALAEALTEADVRALLKIKKAPPFVVQWRATFAGRLWAVRLAWMDLKRALGLMEAA